MKKLSQIPEKTSVFVLEIKTAKNEQNRLYSLGILPEKIISIVKNSHNQAPLIIEVDESRFAIAKNIADKILVTHVLDRQDLIFDEQHKKTEQRTIILNELKNQKGHFTLEEFIKNIRIKNPRIGSITVYRTVKILVEKGILETLDVPESVNKFEIKKGHHDHIICENCGSIMEFRNEEMEQLQEKIAKQHEVSLDSHKVRLFAKSCAFCKK